MLPTSGDDYRTWKCFEDPRVVARNDERRALIAESQHSRQQPRFHVRVLAVMTALWMRLMTRH